MVLISVFTKNSLHCIESYGILYKLYLPGKMLFINLWIYNFFLSVYLEQTAWTELFWKAILLFLKYSWCTILHVSGVQHNGSQF